MNITADYAAWQQWDWHVLVLHDETEADIKGIWGPYTSDAQAQLALTELGQWPIDGVWTCVALKKFTAPASTTGPLFTHRDATRGGGTLSSSTSTGTFTLDVDGNA